MDILVLFVIKLIELSESCSRIENEGTRLKLCFLSCKYFRMTREIREKVPDKYVKMWTELGQIGHYNRELYVKIWDLEESITDDISPILEKYEKYLLI